MNVSDLLVRALEVEGVRYIFGIPGEENEDFMFSLKHSSIEFVTCRHEQGAAFIANIWGRLSGQPGVCLATLGPGATNLITGLADAQLDMTPVVAITGQGGLDRMHHQSHQMIDIMAMFKPITKFNSSIHAPAVTAEVVRKAFRVALLQKPGVTHIELPEDVAAMPVALTQLPLAVNHPANALAETASIEQAAQHIRHAQRPLIIAGNGAIRDAASTALAQLVDTTGIPVVATFMGKGAVSDQREESLLSIGQGGLRDYVMAAVDAADLVLTIGYDIGEYAPQHWNPKADKPIIHADFTPAEVYTHYQPQLELVGDLSATVAVLAAELAGLRCDTRWYAPVRQRILADIASYDLADTDALTIPGTLNIIRMLLPEQSTLISDVGSHKLWIARNWPTYCANGCIISNGLASMGMALPGGIAAALHDPSRPVVSIMGDGGFLMNVQELETAKRLGIACTFVIVTDDEFGLIRWNQDRHHGEHFGTELHNPDFAALAESFGVRAYTPQSPAQLSKQMGASIAARELAVFVVAVDASVNRALDHKLEAYWQETTP